MCEGVWCIIILYYQELMKDMIIVTGINETSDDFCFVFLITI